MHAMAELLVNQTFLYGRTRALVSSLGMKCEQCPIMRVETTLTEDIPRMTNRLECLFSELLELGEQRWVPASCIPKCA